MLGTGVSRRSFLHLAGGALAAAGVAGSGTAYADPASDNQQWVANSDVLKLVGADALPIVSLPAMTPMRVARLLATGQIDVWVPRYRMYGLVAPSSVRSISAPGPQDLAGDIPVGPPVLDGVGLPGRAIGGANLRSWPAVRDDTVLRVVPHNGPLHVLERVEGDAGDEWYNVNMLDAANENIVAHRLHPYLTGAGAAPARADRQSRSR